MKTIYISDLDGTLLTPQQGLSPFTLRALNQLVDQGVAFTYATARSFHSASLVTKGLTLRLPVILYNGVFLRRGDTGENLKAQVFSPVQRQAVKNILEEQGISPLVYTLWEGAERVLWQQEKATPGVQRYVASRKNDPRLLPLGPGEPLYRGEIFYFTCIGTRQELLPAWEKLRSLEGVTALLQEEIYQPGEFWLEVMEQGATKSGAAKTLQAWAGCGRMVAFGDGLNDVPLLQAADYACAVGNGAPPALKAAQEVIPPNTQDGVVRWLLADTAPALALGEKAGEFQVRLYRPSDLEELIQLFYETVHTVCRKDYSPQEVDAWAPSLEGVDQTAWGESLGAHYTVVAQREEQILGFGDMDDTGYLDRLYVHKDFQGWGVASALTQALEGFARALGVSQVTVHASRTARPFFQKRGYRLRNSQKVLRRGVELENFVMELGLSQ